MASIIKRGNTYAVVYYEGHGDKKKQRWESGLSYSAAKIRKAELEYETAKGIRVEYDDKTIAAFLCDFVETYGRKRWGAATYKSNIGMMNNYILPHLGEIELQKLTTKQVDEYYSFLENDAEPVANLGAPTRKRVSPSVIRDIHKFMRCAYNQALRWELVMKNPFANANVPDYKPKVREILTPSQIMKLLDFTDRPNCYELYTLHCAINLSFACCMRSGEITGSQWDRFDLRAQSLYIDRVLDRIDRKCRSLSKMTIHYEYPLLYPGSKTVIVLKQPKTEGSIRQVYTPSTVTEKLRTLKHLQDQLKSTLGDEEYDDTGLIICQPNGRPMVSETLNKLFKRTLKEMNDPEIDPDSIVFHSIRHTSATVKLKISNGNLKAVQGDGGWAGPEMITKRYAHILDEDRIRLAEQMDTEFYGKPAPAAYESSAIETETVEVQLKPFIENAVPTFKAETPTIMPPLPAEENIIDVESSDEEDDKAKLIQLLKKNPDLIEELFKHH